MLRRLLFLLIVYRPILFAQFADQSFRDDTLASVDDHVITTRDLYQRISLMPYEDKVRDRDFESVKQKGVASLIGEYLLAGMPQPKEDDPQRARIIYSVLERLFVRDALFKREVRESVEITDEEMVTALRRYPVRKRLIIAEFPTEKAAARFVVEWNTHKKQQRSAGELLKSIPRQYDTLFITFGSADTALEEAAFRLKQPGEIAGPVRSELFGIVAIVLLDDEPNPAAAGKSFAERHAAVQHLFRDRKESQRQSALVGSYVQKHSMQADTNLFYSVAKRLHELMLRDSVERKIPAGYRYLGDDISSLYADFRSSLDSVIIRGSFGAISLGIFLEHLNYYEYAFPSLRGRPFVQSFFRLLTVVAESEIIAQEGYRRGLNYDPDVRRDLALWMNHRKSRIAEYAAAESVTVRNDEVNIERRVSITAQDSAVADSMYRRERERLLAQRRTERVNRLIAAEAMNHRIVVYDDAIRRADLPEINMITRRTIGFGGRMNAAPILMPQWQWVEEWNRMKQMNP
jgi:hypothetical protein